jgi:hypothetical protein
MINHARTLLLGVSGSLSPPASFPGEEYVPPGFQAPVLPPLLAFFRTILFGGDPDRLMLNYRLSQYMSILHTTELADDVLALDPRITYWPSKRKDLFEDVFGTQVSPADLTVIGSVLPNEAQGRLLHQWLVSNLGGGNYQITRETPLYGEASFSPTFMGGLSSPMSLAGTSLFCVVPQSSAGPWNIQVATRPISTCADVLRTLVAAVSEGQLDQLFGTDDVEPFLTYRKLWSENDSPSYRLGAILMSLTQRINSIPVVPVYSPPAPPPGPPPVVKVWDQDTDNWDAAAYNWDST